MGGVGRAYPVLEGEVSNPRTVKSSEADVICRARG